MTSLYIRQCYIQVPQIDTTTCVVQWIM